MAGSASNQVRIRKFSRTQILFHWTYGVSWILLVLTGIVFLWRPDPSSTAVGLGPRIDGTIGQWARTIHRVAAIGLIISPLIWLLGDRKSLGDFKELLVMSKDDWRYLAAAPLHYTVGKPALPPQGKYNGGHKMNFWVVIVTFVGFVISGLVMWLAIGAVSTEIFKWMLLIHSLCFWVGMLMGVVHIYLTMIHPFTRQALGSMVDGYVGMGYAKAEHKIWVDKEIASGKADMIGGQAASDD
jgi:formate dehydrogenase subunit gamma